MKIGMGLMVAGAVAVVGGSMVGLADKPEGGKKKILFFSPSYGFRHSVVARPLTGELAYAEKMMKEIAGNAGYEVMVSQDFHDLENEKAYKQYDAVVFYTTGNPTINRDGLLKYIREGGALVGIHTATDSFHDDSTCGKAWPEYIHTIGGAFAGHGSQHEVVMKVEDKNHPAGAVVPDGWRVTDEIYLFSEFSRDNVHMLLSIDTEKLDEKTLEGLKMKKGGYYPVAWSREEGKGRVFYTSLGHREDVWTNPVFRKHLMAGIDWATTRK